MRIDARLHLELYGEEAAGALAEIAELRISSVSVALDPATYQAGPKNALRELADLGVYFTVGVEVLRSDAVREIARAIPPDRLLTETDNPVACLWRAGEPGRPRLLLDVLTELGRVLGTSAPFRVLPTCNANLRWRRRGRRSIWGAYRLPHGHDPE